MLTSHRLHIVAAKLLDIGGGRGQWLGDTMASAEHEPITGVWGQSPSEVQGQSPWSGGDAPWSWKHFGHWMSNGAGKFSTSENSMFCYGPLVSDLGGGRVHGAPEPRHWGGCAAYEHHVLTAKFFFTFIALLCFFVPSVLWRCWLGGRNGIRPVKHWVVGYWRDHLSGARCRLMQWHQSSWCHCHSVYVCQIWCLYHKMHNSFEYLG